MGDFTNFVGDQLNDRRAQSVEREGIRLQKEQAELEKQVAMESLKIEKAGRSRERNIVIFNQSKTKLNELIDKAKPKILEIRALSLPKDEFECESMIEEAKMGMVTEHIEYVMEPPTMEDEGDVTSTLAIQVNNIDWKKGSTMICEAWKIRFDKLVKIAKSKYPNAEFTKEALAYNRKKLIIKILKYTAIAIGIGIGLFIVGVIEYYLYKFIF
ncbi:MAG: hypothetical protein MJ009_02260 [Paludibacteraceae bacterium]|nr:hypothetical protein [Paludibacteraceae bacterium]